ncbi:hypothetical protein [Actinomadura chokoriensis]|uniref:Urease accessory protein UreD n=1 Tax=Actinomadura chokoriensis TaxID=454156 RepID=A0ABV4R234_9ACTN
MTPSPCREARREARRRAREAVFGASPGRPADRPPLNALSGTVLDASPHLLVLAAGGTEVRLAMSETTKVWHGGRGGLAALRPGRSVVVRRGERGLSGGAAVADRIWVDIARVAGTILACGRDAVEVDMGAHRRRTHVAIPPHALGQVLVRHPRLEPGYLIDLICVGSPDGPRAVRPGTAQPGYRADALAAPEPAAPVQGVLRGTATWFGDAADEAPDGAAYPAVDSEGSAGGCADAPSGCVPFPYLSVGSEVTVHNACGGRAATVPVVECGCAAARFCDRCVDCDASPRGRIVELTPAAFAGLGGDLDAGCFNASVRVEGPW